MVEHAGEKNTKIELPKLEGTQPALPRISQVLSEGLSSFNSTTSKEERVILHQIFFSRDKSQGEPGKVVQPMHRFYNDRFAQRDKAILESIDRKIQDPE